MEAKIGQTLQFGGREWKIVSIMNTDSITITNADPESWEQQHQASKTYRCLKFETDDFKLGDLLSTKVKRLQLQPLSGEKSFFILDISNVTRRIDQ